MAAENHLLGRLPRELRTRLLGRCEQVPLALAQIIYPGGRQIPHVYFPLDGFFSMVTLLGRKPAMEVGMVGREGMLGIPLALGVKISPMHAIVQGAGMALRMSARAFQGELKRSKALQTQMHLYTFVVMSQLATSTACLGFHRLNARLARWLLMTQDRAQSDRFKVTHEFLAYMLGVRRVGITTAAKALQRQGIINYQRGDLTVLDRRRLQAISCGCYAADRDIYAKWLN